MKSNDGYEIIIPDSMEWELHNLLEDMGDKPFNGMSDFDVQRWVADSLGIDLTRVEVYGPEDHYPFGGD